MNLKNSSKMFEFLNDIGNYEKRKLGKTEVNGLTVSTAYTSDEGYETALIDKNGVHPVERYPDKEAAEMGHAAWCEKAKTIETVTELGCWGLVEDEQIQIVR